MVHERTQPIWIPPGGPGEVTRPSPELFAALGQDGIFALLADVYDRLATTALRPMFPADMRAASERSAAFFVQLLGGPPLFNERHGPPRMRARHMPFEIDESARTIWLSTFKAAVADAVTSGAFPEEHRADFEAFLDGFSAWMVNVAPTE